MTQDERRPSEAEATLPTGPTQEAAGARKRSAQVRRAGLKAAACLLGYPDDAFWLLLPQVEAYLHAVQETPFIATLAQAATTIRELEPSALSALYVATFDFSEPTALYLTAHELGDSRQRGSALLALQSMLRAAGFEPACAELPDYLPMLLEFLSSVPEDGETGEVERRLAAVCTRIHGKLANEHPYKGIFTALLSMLSDGISADPQGQFPGHERADTGTLPYPLRYD
jgi:nitrate reductase delta subunit